jgi:hypothetical protein
VSRLVTFRCPFQASGRIVQRRRDADIFQPASESGRDEDETSNSPTPSFVDSNRRGATVRSLRLRPRRLCDTAFGLKALAPTRRYFAFLRPFRFAVLRAVFFAADLVFDLDFFAILPS